MAKLNLKDFRERTKNLSGSKKCNMCAHHLKRRPMNHFYDDRYDRRMRKPLQMNLFQAVRGKVFRIFVNLLLLLEVEFFAKLKAKDLSDLRDKIGECQ